MKYYAVQPTCINRTTYIFLLLYKLLTCLKYAPLKIIMLAQNTVLKLTSTQSTVEVHIHKNCNKVSHYAISPFSTLQELLRDLPLRNSGGVFFSVTTELT